jgi:hypothetical protein
MNCRIGSWGENSYSVGYTLFEHIKIYFCLSNPGIRPLLLVAIAAKRTTKQTLDPSARGPKTRSSKASTLSIPKVPGRFNAGLVVCYYNETSISNGPARPRPRTAAWPSPVQSSPVQSHPIPSHPIPSRPSTSRSYRTRKASDTTGLGANKRQTGARLCSGKNKRTSTHARTHAREPSTSSSGKGKEGYNG